MGNQQQGILIFLALCYNNLKYLVSKIMSNKKNVSGPSRRRNSYSSKFKLERAIEVIQTNNVSEVSRKYNISANLLYLWRDQLLERGTSIYDSSPDKIISELKSKVSKLEQMVGKKEVELSLLKNFSDFYSSPRDT